MGHIELLIKSKLMVKSTSVTRPQAMRLAKLHSAGLALLHMRSATIGDNVYIRPLFQIGRQLQNRRMCEEDSAQAQLMARTRRRVEPERVWR